MPTVIRWENGGQQVLLSGSFNDWKTKIPMNYRLTDLLLFNKEGYYHNHGMFFTCKVWSIADVFSVRVLAFSQSCSNEGLEYSASYTPNLAYCQLCPGAPLI